MSDKFVDYNIFDKDHKKIASIPADESNKNIGQAVVYDEKGKPLAYVNREESNFRTHHLGSMVAPIYIERKTTLNRPKYVKKELTSASRISRILLYLCFLGFCCYLIYSFFMLVYNGNLRNLSGDMAVLVSALTASSVVMIIPVFSYNLIGIAYFLGVIAGAVVTTIYHSGKLGTFLLSCLDHALIMLPVLLLSFLCASLRRKIFYKKKYE